MSTNYQQAAGGRKYVIVTPVRDEEAFIEGTILSVASQTIPPAEWVIVNDGSADATGAIADRHAGQYPWLHCLHRTDRGFRKAGGGVIDAFNAGYDALRCRDFDYIVKLDGDLTFERDYFERCLLEFEREPKLGVGGGTICNVVDGRLEPEKQPEHHVRGATKIYRRPCWDAIGGLIAAPGWDTADEYKAMMLGWTTRSFPDLHLAHHRPTGQANGAWKGAVKDGIADYVAGFHPLFMGVKCLYRWLRSPFSLHPFGLAWGFLSGYVKRIPQVPDRDLIRFTRRRQMRRLVPSFLRREPHE